MGWEEEKRLGEERETCQVTRAEEQRRARGWKEGARWAWEWESEGKAIRNGVRAGEGEKEGRVGEGERGGGCWSGDQTGLRDHLTGDEKRRWWGPKWRRWADGEDECRRGPGGGWRDKRETGGRWEERERKKENSQARLKYLRCHLCWCMTPPLCNNMNGGGVGCLAYTSPKYCRRYI